MRIDVHLSVHDATTFLKTPSIEIQNISQGPRNVQRTIEYEYRRLVQLLENGRNTEPQIRSFDSEKGITTLVKSNPEKPDYRFF